MHSSMHMRMASTQHYSYRTRPVKAYKRAEQRQARDFLFYSRRGSDNHHVQPMTTKPLWRSRHRIRVARARALIAT